MGVLEGAGFQSPREAGRSSLVMMAAVCLAVR